MSNELTQWILGCLFGIIVGWLFSSAYYWNKIRKLRIQYLETQIKEVETLLNKALKRNKKTIYRDKNIVEQNKNKRLKIELEERVWQTYQNAQGIGKQYSRVAEDCELYLRNGQPNKMRAWRIIKKMKECDEALSENQCKTIEIKKVKT